jgi:hypothetical protein
MAYTKPQTLDATPSGDTVKTAIVSKLDVNAAQIVSDLNTHEALTETHGATGAVVGTTNTQTLTNKTLTTPVVATLYQDAGKTKLITFPAASDTLVGKDTTDTLTNKTLVAPALGTPASGNLANCTFPTLNQDTTGSAATCTGNAATATKLATARAINGVDFDGSAAITIVPRVTTITSSATPTINTDNCDAVTITALAADITSMTTNLSGTPSNFQKLIIRILDDGTARAITWGASFAAKGATLPTTTVISKLLTVGFLYNSVTSKWDCVAASQEV